MDDVLETTAPTPRPRRHRGRIAVVTGTLVAVLAGALAVTLGGDDGPEPLALVAGNDADGRAEGTAAMSAADPVPPMADSKMAYDGGYWGGIEYEVQGDLPDLGGKGRAWRVLTPNLDSGTVTRWANALGLPGTPERRDGMWVLETSEASFSAYPGDGWSISYHRNAGQRSGGDVSAADAEGRARDLLERLGVVDGEWRVESFATEIGVGYACAEAVKVKEEMARSEGDVPVASDGPVAADGSVSSGGSAGSGVVGSPPVMPDCPPPPPPVRGHSVSFFPVLGGMRTEWSGWNVTVGPDGIESLYGTWATFEQGDEYKLRSVDAALEDLRGGSRAVPMPMPMPAIDDAPPPMDPAAEPAIEATAGAEPAIGRATPSDLGHVAVMPYPGPCPPEAECPSPEPQVATITGVEPTLMPNPVYSARNAPPEMYLVPAYRFTGTIGDGEPWETSVIALHPDAIAPPPVPNQTGSVPGGSGSGGGTEPASPGIGIEPDSPTMAPPPAPETSH